MSSNGLAFANQKTQDDRRRWLVAGPSARLGGYRRHRGSRAGDDQLKRAGRPVELGDDQGVAGAAGRERLAQARRCAIGAGQAVIDTDAVGPHAERGEPVTLRR
jgi:hypothetical protein